MTHGRPTNIVGPADAPPTREGDTRQALPRPGRPTVAVGRPLTRAAPEKVGRRPRPRGRPPAATEEVEPGSARRWGGSAEGVPTSGSGGGLGGAASVSSWVPRKGSGFPSPASPLRPLTRAGGVELVGLVSLRAGRVANTPRLVQSDCVGSTLSSLAPFRSSATQPKCGAGRGSCSRKESQYRYLKALQI